MLLNMKALVVIIDSMMISCYYGACRGRFELVVVHIPHNPTPASQASACHSANAGRASKSRGSTLQLVTDQD